MGPPAREGGAGPRSSRQGPHGDRPDGAWPFAPPVLMPGTKGPGHAGAESPTHSNLMVFKKRREKLIILTSRWKAKFRLVCYTKAVISAFH